jgi:hypothetical protein
VESLLNAISPFVSRPRLTHILLPFFEEEVRKLANARGYYATLAVQSLHLAHVHKRVGATETAWSDWRNACTYLCAYGHRKDPTIFELLDSLSTIAPSSTQAAAVAAQAAQPLTCAVLAHTDGKGTKHAPIAWFEALCNAKPAAACILLAGALAKDGGAIDRSLEASLRATLKILYTCESGYSI